MEKNDLSLSTQRRYFGRRFNTFFDSYGRQTDVKTTMCAYWDSIVSKLC